MSDSAQPRVFLVVVDETDERGVAVQSAARRAAHTGGRLALLHVIEPAEMQQWLAVEELARAERRGAAEGLLQRLCEEIAPIAGSMPMGYIREGRVRDELLGPVNCEPAISTPGLSATTRAGRTGSL